MKIKFLRVGVASCGIAAGADKVFEKLCEKAGAPEKLTEDVIKMSTLYGSFEDILPVCKNISANEKTSAAIAELEALYEILKALEVDKNINLDFSIVNDMSYYSGVIFQGFINGISGSVLSGDLLFDVPSAWSVY